MADVVDHETRSRMMAAVRNRHTEPEMRVRRYLHAAGLRFRLHARNLPGVPDLVLPKYRAVVFVHGCFWHQHPRCPKAKLPATNSSFWSEKLIGNARRDLVTLKALREAGWKALVVWECETRDLDRLKRLVSQIRGPAPPRRLPVTRTGSNTVLGKPAK